MGQSIELVPVDDEKTPAVRGPVYGPLGQLDGAETHAKKLLEELAG